MVLESRVEFPLILLSKILVKRIYEERNREILNISHCNLHKLDSHTFCRPGLGISGSLSVLSLPKLEMGKAALQFSDTQLSLSHTQ
jgi:hypothetical protein